MNKIKTIIRYVVSIMVGVFLIGCENNPEDSIRVCQIWKIVYYEDNPYKETITDYREVIEISDEYVLYTQNQEYIYSERKYWFVMGSECVYNCN